MAGEIQGMATPRCDRPRIEFPELDAINAEIAAWAQTPEGRNELERAGVNTTFVSPENYAAMAKACPTTDP